MTGDPNRWQAFVGRGLVAFSVGCAVGVILWTVGAPEVVCGPIAGGTSAAMTGLLYRRAVRRWADR